MKISECVKCIKPCPIKKILEEYVDTKPGFINLGIGEPDFETPDYIKEAAKRALDEGFTHYANLRGCAELRNAIVVKYKREYNLDFNPDENVIVTCGATEAVQIAIKALINPNDEVIMTDPGFAPVLYEPATLLVGGKPVFIKLKEEEGWQINLERLKNLITKKTKLMIINSPMNPTGAVLNKVALKGIAELAEDHNFMVLSDEVYEKILYEGEHYPIHFFTDNAILVNSCSKTFAMAGWRIGYAISDSEIIEAMAKVHFYQNLAISTFCQRAATVALLEGIRKEIKEMLDQYRKRREIIVKGLNRIPGFNCKSPKGTFYAFPNIKGTKMKSEELAKYLIEKSKVITTPGTCFGKEGEGYLRFSFASSIRDINEGLKRIKEVLS